MSDVADLGRAAAGTLWCPADADAVVRFAADELAHYLRRMTGRVLARATVPGAASQLWLAPQRPERAVSLDGDTVIDVSDDSIALHAAIPRDLLAAVYRLLADAGCRWSPRGRDVEDVPSPGTALAPVRSSVHRAAFARRAYASDLTTWHYGVPDRLAARLPQDLAFVDWMAKTGATGWLFIRHAHDDRWLLPELTTALHARGLSAEWGGHALVEWLPRALFRTHPEYFPAAPDGTRSDMGNCCPSAPGALAAIAAGVRAARAAVDGDELHLWGLDLFGGGWCHCTTCRGLTPSDQALQVANAVAEALPAGAPVFHLAYHDTIHAPRAVAPHAGVWAEFAPRERCYVHAIDDPTCDVNPHYRGALAAHLECFDGRVDVFEYYADTILFGGCAVPLDEVIARDLAYYRAAGVRGVSCLTFGRYSHLAHGTNLQAFAAGVHAPAAARGGRRAHCRDVFGAVTARAEAYFAQLERAVAPLLRGGDVKLPARGGRQGDHMRAALGHATAARAELEVAVAALPRGARSDAERTVLRYTLETIAGLHALCTASDDPDAALDRLQLAAESFRGLDLAHIGTWGAVDLEFTHAYYAAGLRAGDTVRAPFVTDAA